VAYLIDLDISYGHSKKMTQIEKIVNPIFEQKTGPVGVRCRFLKDTETTLESGKTGACPNCTVTISQKTDV
jgi:hypothetical protein